ncbi:hypothetical protein GCM10022261_28680 [Brevibacterium daeguense]|uniref:DNA primase n=1 Tax=Brevibacterium daeguense TaxID=909936 RepID=A0ABP8ENG7_9MICO|nr:DNA primase [Brevibacterium daeguense]
MAGLIRREDIDEVRARARLDEVVGEYVTLKNAGVGSMKGLCPFHDERTPSFHVRPQVGLYHCFGCGESGDVFSFLQKIDGMTFAESVERLAEKVGVQLVYEEGKGPDREAVGRRQRLIDMHEVAEGFFREQLKGPAAQIGRQYLDERGFDADACATFGVGFAPQSWDALLNHLRGRGFETQEIIASGLVSQGRRGIYDRFRGRLVWPIRDVTGRTIGFGARRLFDDDQGPKYLNTPETPIYRKNQVLYGLDLAKRSIAKTKRIVIVEGYTDVMAAHLSGVQQAVATCGTAFGAEHVKIARRLLGDDSTHSGEVVFTFDGDEAGRAAALKAFEEDQRFVTQTFVAVEKHGMDPCDLRIAQGDSAVRELIESRRPLFEFAITSTVDRFDLSTVEGRVGAMRAVAPVIAQIRDAALRPGYERFVAGHLGVDPAEVARAVRAARKSSGPGSSTATQPGRPSQQDQRGQHPAGQYDRQQSGQRSRPRQEPWGRPGESDVPDRQDRGRRQDSRGQQGQRGQSGQGGSQDRQGQGGRHGRQGRDGVRSSARPTGSDDVADTSAAVEAYASELGGAPVDVTGLKVERGALQVALQQPGFVNAKLFDGLNVKVFSDPAHRLVHRAMQEAGGIRVGLSDPANWPEKVLEAAPDEVRGLVGELAVEPIPATDSQGVERYSRGIIARLFDKDMVRIAGELHSRLQRTDPTDVETSARLLDQLQILERQRARLRSMM